MIVQDLEQLKNLLQKVLVDEGVIDFCQKCPIPCRCCNILDPFCDFVINKRDCAENAGKSVGSKKLRCFFYLCPEVQKNHKELGNWLSEIHSSMEWPNTNAANETVFPLEIEDFNKDM